MRCQPVQASTMKYREGEEPLYSKLLLYRVLREKYSCYDNATIGIIDNGIDATHPELSQDVEKSYEYTSENDVLKTGDHATHVAGIISSRFGLSETIILHSHKALRSESGAGSFRDVARAIDQARKDGISIINLSLGSSSVSALVDVALKKYLEDPNNFAVIATGNDGSDTNYPASLSEKYPNAIAVGSGNITSESQAALSSFSSRGIVTLIAQGEDVLSTIRNGRSAPMSGTSMATPSVSAVISMAKGVMRSQGKEFNCFDFKHIIADACIDLYGVGKDDKTGYGFLIPDKFMRLVEDMSRNRGIERGEMVELPRCKWYYSLFSVIKFW